MAVTRLPCGTGYDDIAARVYQGEVLEFGDGAGAGGGGAGGGAGEGAGAAFVFAARGLCRRVFEMPNIELAHQKYKRKQFLARAAVIQQEFNTAPYKTLFKNWLEEIGCAKGAGAAGGGGSGGGDLYWDTLGLRIAPPVLRHGGGFRSHVGVHRDTWGAAIGQQINWWGAVMPLSFKRTMAFYPEFWDRALKNSSAEWSFAKYLESRAAAKKSGRAAAYPSAPQNLAHPHTPPQLVKPACGSVLVFSSAHLHSSVMNQTDKTRFSFEVRTVSKAHVLRGGEVGPPNADCDMRQPLYQLFRGVDDDSVRLSGG